MNNSPLKIAGMVLKPNAPYMKDEFLAIKRLFEENGISVLFEETSAKMIGESGFTLDDLAFHCDFLVSLGGDGTLISLVRRSFKHNLPVLGVHLGNLGFLTDITVEELGGFMNELKNNDFSIDQRMMISTNINSLKVVAFNDIVITRKHLTGMVNIEAKIDSKVFNSYYGDGLIISTPTGSTGYNLSCGGPVVYPLTDAFIVTPISAHSLTQRPLVLPVDFEIELCIKDEKGAVAIVDGHDIYELKQNDSFKINIAPNKAKLIHSLRRSYFDVLSEKLKWGENH
ncbi:MAG: NAD(+) kinase [Arcobacter butzleri]|jgi:NAD+ kinase|nr:NAD(+)/NADH kinase [Arcobacteraceae bacterium]MDY0365146.1 NAD(+)/NADH kinase [Arcobacteraceae bacterium]NLO18197.1 NAD(+) kinase [Aliarcobacter butzleri]